MTPFAVFGLGMTEIIVLSILMFGFLAVVVGVVVLVTVLNKPKGPTND
jgi:hypothetical protein